MSFSFTLDFLIVFMFSYFFFYCCLKNKKISCRSLCLLASMNKNLIVITPTPLSSPLELDYNQIKIICLDLFNDKKFDDPLCHVYKCAKRCEGLSVCDISNDIIKANFFFILCLEMLRIG
jgi:hypothetical protein